MDASLDDCRRHDSKGLYVKASRGEIKDFTGIDSPYEVPENPEIRIDSDNLSVAQAINQMLAYLDAQSIIALRI